ncbi:MAG: hypothetical protein COW00_11955 [Bdellovibrio sp. CG12_big_fil_rev_8_21_14_0_65_39_13]|nr:MAG: hypothetical protein COW78_00750 [Bdellovibrio sp. CG22_combo_CG10-13_8_21_14_all_39_27]PIQ59168.1 MAG: hypothetical protein COW00_11955 [Bdellovibrio sp. CG12_big_fil_rev_8_21_14_0_65_39_13]PIR33308.1 MAG: hypothetical protein COV37_16745 [Bdellovibrio sp. CG11_big_fil_rev_8_21_14_0_20_39_38]
MNKTRRSLEEIYKDMDAINKSKPTDKQIDELAVVIRKINEENEGQDSSDSDRKIARSDSDNFAME